MKIISKICNYQKFYLSLAIVSLISGIIFHIFAQNAPHLWEGVAVGYSLGGTILFFHVIFKSVVLWLNKNKSLSDANRQKVFKSKRESLTPEDAPTQASGPIDNGQKTVVTLTQTSTLIPPILTPATSSSDSTPQVRTSTNIYTGINQENALAFVNEQLSKRPSIEIGKLNYLSGRLKNLAQLYLVLICELYQIQKKFSSRQLAWQSAEAVNKERELFAVAYAYSHEALSTYKKTGSVPFIELLNITYGRICKMGMIRSQGAQGEVYYDPAPDEELLSHQRRLFGGQDLEDVRLLYNSFCTGLPKETPKEITNHYPLHKEGDFFVVYYKVASAP